MALSHAPRTPHAPLTKTANSTGAVAELALTLAGVTRCCACQHGNLLIVIRFKIQQLETVRLADWQENHREKRGRLTDRHADRRQAERLIGQGAARTTVVMRLRLEENDI